MEFYSYTNSLQASDCLQVKAMDSLPETAMKVGDSFMGFFVDEGNVTLVTLFVCLLTVLYMRQRQRRTMPVNIRPPPQ
jgi:SEL1 protein